jgi:predicted dehydrogenase
VLADQGGELRAVADIGTHWMDLVTSITGLQVEAVFADLRTVHETRRRPTGEVQTFTTGSDAPVPAEDIPITTEDTGAVLLRFAGGARGVLWVSQTTAGRKNCLRYEIAGAEQTLAWDSEEPNTLWIGRRAEANQLLIRDPSLPGAQGFSDYPGGHNEGFPDTFKQCFRAFYGAIDGSMDETLYPSFADGHREILLCEAILRSHREERWVTLG